MDRINQYDLSDASDYIERQRIKHARKEYINAELTKLRFEYGADHLNPYDLGQMARVNEIFRSSWKLYHVKGVR